MKYPHSNVCLLILAAGLVLATPAAGQITPEEHASHHAQPGPAEAPPFIGNGGPPDTRNVPGPGMRGGMGGGMGKHQPGAGEGPGPGRMGPPADIGPSGGMGGMMEKMGTPPPKELYPLLMDIPDLPPEQRAEVEQLAHERMKTGAARLSSGLEKLSESTGNNDYSAMQEATEHMRQGLAQFESGLAAHRALREGQVTRNVALQWFKREMSLASPIPRDELRGILGVTPFHLFTMGLLIAFAVAMIVMYFFKMRRAAALFGRINPSSRPPAGGKSQGGGPPPPAAPPAAAAPPPGGTPSPAAPASPATSPAEGSPAPPPGGSSAVPVPGGDAAKSADTPPAPPAAGGSAASPATSEATSAPPLTAKWQGQLWVASIVPETPTVKTFRLLPSPNSRSMPFTFLPGQFLNVTFWIGGAKMNRSYSISSSPTQREYVELTVRREPRGAVSRHMVDLLKVGDQMEAGGPVGKFTFTGTEADSIVLISGGVGVTPMMSITRFLTERSWAGDIFFIYTCQTPTDFIFANEIAELQHLNPKLHVAVTITRADGTGWKGARGRITKDWLAQTVPDLASRISHLCGPPAMMDGIKAIFAELGIPPDRLKTEAFGTPKPAPAAPATAETAAKPTTPATGPLVTFSKSTKSAKIRVDLQSGDSPPKQSILELSEELGIGIDFSCRVGTCGLCKVKMTSGEVEQAVEDALDADDKATNIILACQAKPKSEVVVEA